MLKQYKNILYTVLILILINVFGQNYFYRIDLTDEKKYSLSFISKEIITQIKETLTCEIYLDGNFPAGFKKLQKEVIYTLQQIKAYNKNIKYKFVNLEEIEDRKLYQNQVKKLFKQGIKPINLKITNDGEYKSKQIFPWVIFRYKKNQIVIPLLKSSIGEKPESQINNSIENLEYAFINAINKISVEKGKRIAFLKGHQELQDIYISDITKTLQESYIVERYQINSQLPFEQRVKNIQKYDVLIIAKPLKSFSDKDNFLIDNYIMNGGKIMWLLDFVKVNIQNLYTKGKTTATYDPLNLSEILFKYGIRINPYLVKDMQSAPMKIAIGKMGSRTQYQNFRWEYTPLAIPFFNHPIINNINAVKFEYVCNIDTILSPNIKKEPLLFSSKYSKLSGIINSISLESLKQKKDVRTYNKPYQLLGISLTGNFTSAYKNRIKPFKYSGYTDKSKPTKMIVFADGDLIANQVLKGRVLPLGYDKWTNQQYGNKELMINAINYLLDKNGLINIRSKSMKIRLLDKNKIQKQRGKWQLINLVTPLCALLILYVVFSWGRKKKIVKR